jgi:hypothetical protein
MFSILLFKRTYFHLINLKRKQALLESNLPAIRLMVMIINAAGNIFSTLLFNINQRPHGLKKLIRSVHLTTPF